MPLFARRRLQSMLDEIAPHLDEAKARDIVRRLEDKRVDQVLPAEIELALLWALSRIGEIDIEPEWWGDARRPDAYTEALVLGEPAVVEIAAPNDNAISGEAVMDAIALRFSEAASRLRKGVGEYLYFSFASESGYEDGVYYRRRLTPLDYELTASARGSLERWVRSGEIDNRPLRILEPGLDVTIQKKPYRQTRFHNTWSSMPPETHSVEDNPLYKLLVRKLAQVKGAPRGTHRFIFLGDAGSTLLRRIGEVGEIDPTRRFVSAKEILSHFVTANAAAIDAVVAIAPARRRNPVGRDDLFWKITAFPRPNFTLDLAPLNALLGYLPRPLLEGYQARSLFRQGMFDPKGPGLYLPPRITTSMRGPVTIRLPARAVLDLLAGRIDAETFRRETGGLAMKTNLFKLWLDQGRTIQGAAFEPGGLDEDDDHLVLTLADDPSARELHVPDTVPKPDR
jgi:hypothetical protein